MRTWFQEIRLTDGSGASTDEANPAEARIYDDELIVRGVLNVPADADRLMVGRLSSSVLHDVVCPTQRTMWPQGTCDTFEVDDNGYVYAWGRADG